MPQASRNLKRCIFGLNRAQVDYELMKNKKEYTIQIMEKRHSIEKLKIENEILRNQLEKINPKGITETRTVDLMEFALKKAEEYIPLFYEAAERETQRLISLGEGAERLFNEKIKEFDETIKQTKVTLDALLRSILFENDNLGNKLKQFIQQKDLYKFLNNKDLAGMNEILQESKEQIKKEYTNLKNESQRTTDKIHSGDLKIEEKRVEKDWNNVLGKSQYDEKDLTEAKLDKIRQFITGTASEDYNELSFWGTNEGGEDKLIEKEAVNNIEPKPIVNIAEDLKLERPQINNSNSVDQAVARDIDNIRLKYLIDKVTGADLLDRDGNIIVKKNSKITNEVIYIAEKEGKLAELIVNMIISDRSF